MAKIQKDEEIKVRVTKETKRQVEYLAEEREESESLIVREAIAEYLASHAKISESSLAKDPHVKEVLSGRSNRLISPKRDKNVS